MAENLINHLKNNTIGIKGRNIFKIRKKSQQPKVDSKKINKGTAQKQ